MFELIKEDARVEGGEDKTVQLIVKAIKSGKFSIHEIADFVDEDITYVMEVKARIER